MRFFFRPQKLILFFDKNNLLMGVSSEKAIFKCADVALPGCVRQPYARAAAEGYALSDQFNL